MNIKSIIFFSLLSILQNCTAKQPLHDKYSLEQNGIRKLDIKFVTNTMGVFEVKYNCSDTLKFKQEFKYKRISKNIIMITGIKKQNQDRFFYLSQNDKNSCPKSKEYLYKIPLIGEEKVLMYQNKLFWQKIQNKKIISAFTFSTE